jgi:photosystem II stability/assembly factor-like uncharacterized protein
VPSSIPTVPLSLSVNYDFRGPNLGWAVLASDTDDSQAYVFRTTDGAKHWDRIASFTGSFGGFGVEIKFLDLSHGFISGFDANGYVGQGSAFGTEDGGFHWKPIVSPDTSRALTFPTIEEGWVLTAAYSPLSFKLFSTLDRGTTWKQVSWPQDALWSGNGRLPNLQFRADGEGWVGSQGDRPVVHSTTDGGATWQAHSIPAALDMSPTPPVGLALSGAQQYSVFVQLLPKIGVIAFVLDGAGDEKAFVSFDQGSSWQSSPQPPDGIPYEAISTLDSRHWWAFYSRVLLKTSNSGATWVGTRVSSLLENWNYSPAHLIDTEHAWSIQTNNGASGLAMTSDGGVTWNPVEVPRLGRQK